jgi:hypothetical protein
MVDTQDLHQIEYRHHQTRDLSPVASSMSRESVLGWDARIRAWVRHPHSEALSESVCYQVFPNGTAALAWRFWDKQAAVRADGSRGRPLVSRVLVGPAVVLSPEVAVALCRTGPAPDLVGPPPGRVAADAGLPMVSGAALGAVARDMAAELDAEAAAQDGLQAVVAAALAEPSAPLGISAQDSVIRRPLRDGVQGPLLWGLCRIAGPVLGPAAREWSFSTFELPLGDMDPASLPRIVFRELQHGMQPPPARTRREIQVRPFAPSALGGQTPYAARVGLAGWLVAEYQAQGGDWLERFAVKSCGSERTSQLRLERVYDALLATRAPIVRSGELTRPVSALPAQAGDDQVRGDDASAAVIGPAVAMPAGQEATAPGAAAAELTGGERAPADLALPDRALAGDSMAGDAATVNNALADEAVAGSSVAGNAVAGFGGLPVAPQYAQPSGQDGVAHPAPGTEQAPSGGHWSPPDGGRPPRAGREPAGWSDERRKSLASSKEGLTPPELPAPGRGEYQAGYPRNPHLEPGYEPRQRPSTLSGLLQQLELVRDDPRMFDDYLKEVLRIDPRSVDADDRRNSWDVIRINGWYERISEENSFYKEDVAHIFRIVVIPELGEPDVADKVARWALGAPDRMIEGLLLAAKKTDPETWRYVMRILEPVLALLHAQQGEYSGQWDPAWAMRPAEYPGRGDGKGAGLWNRLRRG